MQAKEGVLDWLQNILTMELTAVNRYFVQAEMCQNWGYERLYERLRSISLSEMQDAQRLIRHILYLEGIPNVQRLNQVALGESVLEDLQIDLAAEKEIVNSLAEAIAHCATVSDFTTRGMLEEMIRDEETHVDWFETQLETVRQIGIDNYLTEQLHD
jgi:bacterioferritin